MTNAAIDGITLQCECSGYEALKGPSKLGLVILNEFSQGKPEVLRKMPRHLWKELNDLSEKKLRTDVILPLLQHTPGLEGITDIHGKNEAGLDVAFFTRDAIRRTCFGLQLKKGNIGGGAKTKGTVEEVITQLRLARKLKHPMVVGGAGEYRVERFIVATSGNITEGARREIAGSIEEAQIDFWDGHEIMRRLRDFFPELLSGIDAATVTYLTNLAEIYDRLEALDQIQTVHKRTLTDIFEEPHLRRQYVPNVVPGKTSKTAVSSDLSNKRTSHQKTQESSPIPEFGPAGASVSAAILMSSGKNSVLIADQNDGKTSLIRMLSIRRARALLSGTSNDVDVSIPVIVRAQDLLSVSSTFGAIQAEINRLKGSLLKDSLGVDLADGVWHLFIDGFSELPSERQKEECQFLIAAFERQFPKTVVSITGRPADFLEPKFFAHMQHYTIDVFSDDQLTALARKYAKGIESKFDVTKKMVARIKDALQLPGSPIPAIIGVMVYDEEKRYVTNTAEAVDAYMAIRLGRYARELGIAQEVEWSRKQDLLAEVAFEMVKSGVETVTQVNLEYAFNDILSRLGEVPRGAVAVKELIESGVLVPSEEGLRFHRIAFRDFFAGQHVFRSMSVSFDNFFGDHLFDKKWGPVLMFAAGLRRHNSDLLLRLTAKVSKIKEQAIGAPSSDYIYGSYLLGRLLTNSEASDEAPRLAVIRLCLDACGASIPEFIAQISKDIGNIGELAALIGVEQTFNITVGVPWLALQFKALALDSSLGEDERYLVTSALTNTGEEGWLPVVERVAKGLKSPRVLLVLFGLTRRLRHDRNLNESERNALKNVEKLVLKGLKGNEKEVRRILQFKSRLVELEMNRIKRLNS